MGRKASIWFRKQTGNYYVNLGGKQINLGSDKDAAEKAFHKLKAADEPLPAGMTAAVLMDKFLIWTKEHKAESTFDWYNKHLQRFLDHLPQQSIAASAVKPFHVYEACKKGWSQSYRRGFMVAIQRAFRWAIKQGYLEKNPLTHLEKPMAERREVYPTQQEYDEMVALATEPFKSILEFCYEVGCRPQEACNIEPEYIKGDRVVFPVKKSKGKKYATVIHMTDKARRLLGDGFRNARGRKWTCFALDCRMKKIALKTGKKFCMYSIRHLFATRMLEAGLDHITVARLMNHRDPSMLAKIYQHIGEKNDFLLEQLRRVS